VDVSCPAMFVVCFSIFIAANCPVNSTRLDSRLSVVAFFCLFRTMVPFSVTVTVERARPPADVGRVLSLDVDELY